MDGKALSDPTLRAGDPKNLPDVPYRGLVCALLFIARYTRPDIMFAVCFLCRYLSNYTDAHWKAAKRILIYLKNTTDIKLRYTRFPKAKPLEVYTDSDFRLGRMSRIKKIDIRRNNLCLWQPSRLVFRKARMRNWIKQ